MTTHNLERGKEIQSVLDDLKRALSEVSRGKLFSIDHQTCMYKTADPFLGQVENEVRIMAQEKILLKIEELNREFESL